MDTLSRIQGSIHRVTFHSEETGFCVLRVKIDKQKDVVSVVGNVVSINAGEMIECFGHWVEDTNHGLQFKAQNLNTLQPNTLEGIKKYLGSGMLKGIGPQFASKLVEAFGKDVFDIIENSPERLTEIPGMSKKLRTQLVSDWAEQKWTKEIILFLQSHGVSTASAVRIYKAYGDRAIETVRSNPYRLTFDIRGLSFKMADELALKLGVAKDAMIRAQAAVNYVLNGLCDRGHCAVKYDQLVRSCITLLGLPESLIIEAIQKEVDSKNLMPETINDENYIFPENLYSAELSVANDLTRILAGEPPWGAINLDTIIPWANKKTTLQLSDSQEQAIRTILQHKVSIVTGGPGVGKTSIINSFLKIMHKKRLSVALTAPTGRAAKRLTETTGTSAKTIHRLLEFQPESFVFKYDQDKPLPIDVLVVDEASMIDIVLFQRLLNAIPHHAALLIVGDIDQLPSVGPGAVLSDIIQSGIVPTVKLTEIFRQAANSYIILNAHRINQAKMFLPNNTDQSDFYTLFVKSPEDIFEKLIHMVTERIPNHFNCNPITDIQVLTPMNKGDLGSKALNTALQEKLNCGSDVKISKYGQTFSTGDKVIQTVNNYEKDIYNGDVGVIESINMDNNTVRIVFDGRTLKYDVNELDEINLAYAISIHKSQGSEFPIVVMPLSTQHYPMLARNLLYTGITRGKKLVILIAQKAAVEIAVKNNNDANRLTNLDERLCHLQRSI